MRSLVVVCALGSIASADPTFQFDVLAKGNPGDWTLFEAERRTDHGQLIKDRVIALVTEMSSSPLMRRIVWFRGSSDHEVPWPDTSIHQMLLDLRGESETKIEAATCKLDTSFPCVKVTYAGRTGFGAGKVTVSATIAERIRGSNLLELEVTEGTEVQWRLKAIGYGSGRTSAWGAGPSKAKLDVPADTETMAISGIGTRSFGSDFLSLGLDGNQPRSDGEVGSLVVKGDLAKALVYRYLKRELRKLHDCYDKVRRAKPKLPDKVDFAFAIQPDGKVASSSAKGLDPDFERCAADVVKGIEFPKPNGASQVDVSFSIDYETP